MTRFFFVVSAVAAMAVALAPAGARAVVLPAAAITLVAAGFFDTLWRRTPRPPVDEIGTWFVAAGSVYGIFPLAVFLALGLTYTPLNDSRLFALQPSPGEIAAVGWLYFAFLFAFAVAYIAARGRDFSIAPRIEQFPAGLVEVAAVGWVLLWSFFFYLNLGADAAESYTGNYAQLANLPLALGQAIKLAKGWHIILTLVLLVWVFTRFRERWWVIGVWFLFQAAELVTAVGSRTGFMLVLAAMTILFHRYVRPIGTATAVTIGTLGLVAFLLLGVLRMLQAVGAGDFVFGFSGGEFETVFGNAVDLRAKISSGELGPSPFAFYVSDLVAFFPSQLLPFQKVDLAEWYVHAFYPVQAEQGFASAFGVVSQAVIGFGWPELVLRGGIVGFLFGRLHRYHQRYGSRVWVSLFYLWMIVWCYQIFRNTSFSILSYIIQQFIPALLIVEAVRSVLLSLLRPRQAAVSRSFSATAGSL